MAAKKFFTDLDLNLNQLIGTLIERLDTDPTEPPQSRLWYNTTEKMLKYHDGTSAVPLSGVEFQKTDTALQWRTTNGTWVDLFEIEEIADAINDGGTGETELWSAAYLDQIITSINNRNHFAHEFIDATTITVTHNMNKFPSVSVVDSAGTAYEVDVQHNSPLQLEIHLNSAMSGFVYCN